MYYTGVGSRETPKEIGIVINKIALKLQDLGYTLRSGHAGGADTFFEENITEKEIFIPWKSFGNGIVPEYSSYADSLLQEIHPAYNKLTQGAKKLHLRNVNQVLGQDLNTPSKFLICWADTDTKGIPKGGTRTAWLVAEKFDVPCFNLKNQKDFDRIVCNLKIKL